MESNTKGNGQIKNIKSKYILSYIFSFINKNKKLKLLFHNKKIQKIFDLTLDDYKKECRIYRIINDDGKGKEFLINSDILLFEGDYKNGKKNGIGIEYSFTGKIIFEGEYENGIKKNGKGYDCKGNIILTIENGNIKEFFDNGQLMFKGKYLNGKKWNGIIYNYNGIEKSKIINGKGDLREYCSTGELLFEGKCFDGLKNGKGREYYENGKVKFDGNYLNGLKNGKGIEFYDENHMSYDGEFFNGLRNGEGEEYKGSLYFKGVYKNGKVIKGIFSDPETWSREILVLNDEMTKEYYCNGNLHFEGEFNEGVKWNGVIYNDKGEKEFEIKEGKGFGKEFNFME